MESHYGSIILGGRHGTSIILYENRKTSLGKEFKGWNGIVLIS